MMISKNQRSEAFVVIEHYFPDASDVPYVLAWLHTSLALAPLQDARPEDLEKNSECLLKQWFSSSYALDRQADLPGGEAQSGIRSSSPDLFIDGNRTPQQLFGLPGSQSYGRVCPNSHRLRQQRMLWSQRQLVDRQCSLIE